MLITFAGFILSFAAIEMRDEEKKEMSPLREIAQDKTFFPNLRHAI